MPDLVRGLHFKVEPGDSGCLLALGCGQPLLTELPSYHGQSVDLSPFRRSAPAGLLEETSHGHGYSGDIILRDS